MKKKIGFYEFCHVICAVMRFVTSFVMPFVFKNSNDHWEPFKIHNLYTFSEYKSTKHKKPHVNIHNSKFNSHILHKKNHKIHDT